MRAHILLFVVILLQPLMAANADIMSTSSSVMVGSLPADLRLGATQNETTILAFEEQHEVLLASPLHLNLVAPSAWDPPWGEFFPPAALGGDLPAGTWVNSHLIRLDPVTYNAAEVTGTIRFSNPILGLLVTPYTLSWTDQLLGIPGTTYSGLQPYRGVEEQDNLQITAVDPYTVQFSLWSGPYMDEFRVITAGGGTPEPVTGILTLAGGVICLRRGRRRC